MKATKRPNDFKAVELKLTENAQSPHTIYFKEHSVREHTEDRPSGRTLFIVNIPPYADEQGLRNAFSEAGIATVHFSLKPSAPETKDIQKFMPEQVMPCFRVAYLVFEKVSQVDHALHLTELRPMNWNDHTLKVGIKKWIEQHNNTIFPPKTMKENIETFMKAFDEKMTETEGKEKELEQEDAEGWVTVTKRGKVQSFARTEKVENKILEKEEKKKKRKELKNFYTFQIRESKMKHIVALRQKFEEDKKKIAQIKQTRRFKPF